MTISRVTLPGSELAAKTASLALFARQWVDAATADDVVQKALVALWSQGRPPNDPLAWTFIAVRNAAISAARAAGRRRKHERAASVREWFQPSLDDGLDAKAAEEALQELEQPFREVLILRLWGGLGFAEIAAITGTGLATAHGRYTAGIERLRLRLSIQRSADVK